MLSDLLIFFYFEIPLFSKNCFIALIILWVHFFTEKKGITFLFLHCHIQRYVRCFLGPPIRVTCICVVQH